MGDLGELMPEHGDVVQVWCLFIVFREEKLQVSL